MNGLMILIIHPHTTTAAIPDRLSNYTANYTAVLYIDINIQYSHVLFHWLFSYHLSSPVKMAV